MNIVAMPPGASAESHCHEAHESAVYVLEGEAEMRHGPKLIEENVALLDQLQPFRTKPVSMGCRFYLPESPGCDQRQH
jgi:oxalate decarboxylase/phosphoglucose isomerase-like protein (cupin superfamily)